MDPYAVLGLSGSFTFHQLSEAYRRAAAQRTGALPLVASAFEALSRTERSGPGRKRSQRASAKGRRGLPGADTALSRALGRLKRQLQLLSPAQRLERVESLSAKLRLQLLRFMELTAPVDRAAQPDAASVRVKGCGLQRNRQGLYRAKMNLEHISLYSAFVPAEDAVESHILLAKIRHLVALRMSRLLRREEGLFEAFQAAFAQLEDDQDGSVGDVNAFLLRRGIRAYLTIHAHRWLGSTHVTSPVLPLAEVVALRQRLLSARERGWAAFRAAWVAMMEEVGLPRCRRMPAAAFADARRRGGEGQAGRGKKRRAEKSRSRLQSAVQAAERAVARLEPHLRTGNGH
ncbi:unnamed protein product [Effrenium voratum]|nr:unnamed protein product [Effrenium voratum]